MIQSISMLFMLLMVIVVGLFTNMPFFNDYTMIDLLNRLPILFIPANYVFYITPVIYLLLAFWIFGLKRDSKNISRKTYNLRVVLFILSTFFKIAYILLWHYEFFKISTVILIISLITLATLYFTYPKYENIFWKRIPISFYFGWTIFIFATNVNYLLTLYEWSGWGLSINLWTVIFLTIVTAVALHFLYHHHDFSLNILFMWAFIGIAVRNGFNALFVSSASLFLTAVIGVALILNKTKRFSSHS